MYTPIPATRSFNPSQIYDVLGEPLKFPINGFNPWLLQKGDFAVVVDEKPAGAIFFLRPFDASPPTCFDEGDVIAVRHLIEPFRPAIDTEVLAHIAADRFQPVFCEGNKVYEIQVPFWILR